MTLVDQKVICEDVIRHPREMHLKVTRSLVSSVAYETLIAPGTSSQFEAKRKIQYSPGWTFLLVNNVRLVRGLICGDFVHLSRPGSVEFVIVRAVMTGGPASMKHVNPATFNQGEQCLSMTMRRRMNVVSHLTSLSRGKDFLSTPSECVTNSNAGMTNAAFPSLSRSIAMLLPLIAIRKSVQMVKSTSSIMTKSVRANKRATLRQVLNWRSNESMTRWTSTLVDMCGVEVYSLCKLPRRSWMCDVIFFT
jgi:hypothetical protein